MTFRDEPMHDETDPLIGRPSDGAAWSETAYTASATELPAHHGREPQHDSAGGAIPWEEAPKRSRRPPNATLLIGLAVAGGIVLVVAIVWATFMRQDSSTGLSSGGDPFASSSKSAHPTSASSASSSSAAASTGRSGTPAAVADPDGAGQRCSEGFHVKGRKGFGTHSVRGSRETSCAFASKVLEAYWEQVGMPTKDPKRITAAGSVSCRSTGAECAGNDFVMNCAAQNDEDWITCVGGKNARIYIY